MEKLPDEGMAEETREGTAAEVTKISKNVNGGHKGWHEREGLLSSAHGKVMVGTS